MSEKAEKTFNFTMQTNIQLYAMTENCAGRCLKHGDYVRTDF